MSTQLLTRSDEVGVEPFDSIAWLFEVHILEQDTHEYNFALLDGNEDWPSRIELWKAEPNWDTPADRVLESAEIDRLKGRTLEP